VQFVVMFGLETAYVNSKRQTAISYMDNFIIKQILNNNFAFYIQHA